MKTPTHGGQEKGGMARRLFLRYATGGAALTAAVFTADACKSTKDVSNPRTDIGTGDLGILNYVYALEQVAAAFYTQIVTKPFTGMTVSETVLLTNIRDHEIAHRDLFKAALGANAIIGVQPYFGSVNFSSRFSVLSTAQLLKDLSVAAYNGVAALIQKPEYLELAGKIVSVEARHAALIRELILYNSFEDSGIVDTGNTSLEKSKSIGEVLAVANQFLGAVKISAQAFGIF